ncbi:unnamed protein product [Adineta steineri]|uniref:RRM domain-containing protein n=1 Tax=Adineta steineri TaxID=433720 RepID=A0A818Y4B8_9BILA|nr:unnamed protein product [Adineta steineri]
MQVMIPNLQITSVVPTSFTNTYTCWNNNNAQVQYEPMELPNLQATSDPLSSNMTLVDRMTNEYLSELNTQTSQPFMTDIVSTNVSQDRIDNINRNNRFNLCEELMDFLPVTTSSNASINNQTKSHIETSNPSTYSLSTRISAVTEKNDNNDKSNSNQLSKHQNTLYAFVVHRTHEKARRNLRRPINRSLLGSQCRVEWNTHCSDYSNNEQNIKNRKIVVRGISENVNENDLLDLFVNCHILKYCPARRIYSSTTTMETKGQNKILPGYAFLIYGTEQQAANVIEQADQYKINGQSLVISLYHH